MDSGDRCQALLAIACEGEDDDNGGAMVLSTNDDDAVLLEELGGELVPVIWVALEV